MGLELELEGKLTATLNSLADSMAKQHQLMRRLEDALSHVPADYPITGSAYTNASGLAVIQCQGPPQGRQWQVRQLTVGGPTKGVVYSYASASQPITSPLQIIGMKDATKTRWPCPGFYGTHQFMVNPSEILWVVVATSTDTTQVVVSGAAEDYELAAVRAAWSE